MDSNMGPCVLRSPPSIFVDADFSSFTTAGCRKYLVGSWDATSFILWYGYNWSEDDKISKKQDAGNILNSTLPDLSDNEHDDDVDISNLS